MITSRQTLKACSPTRNYSAQAKATRSCSRRRTFRAITVLLLIPGPLLSRHQGRHDSETVRSRNRFPGWETGRLRPARDGANKHRRRRNGTLRSLDLLRRRPDLALRMLGSMSLHLRVIVGLLDDLTLKDMETRLANWLLKQCPYPITATPVEIKLSRTKRVLAAEMGTTSETLSRTLAKFRDQKLLRVTGNTVVVMRPRDLQKLLQRNLGEV